MLGLMLTLKEAAAELGLHVDTLRWQIHNGKLKAHKIGPLWVVSRRELNKYRAIHMRHPSPEPGFGRLLRYVWLPSATGGPLLVNEELVRLGYASSSSYPPDVRHQDRFVAAQRDAADGGRGLWAATPAPQPTSQPVAPLPVAGSCDPSYPGVCIPPAPPDLDCGDITFRRFQVVAPDPHGFDGNHDGVGCES